MLRLRPVRLEGFLALRMRQEYVQIAHAIRDGVRRFDNHAARGFLAQICKFRKHIIGGSKVQRRLEIRILKALGGHQHRAEYAVRGFHEMHIARGAHGNVHFIAQPQNFSIQFAQTLVVRHRAFALQKFVIADRLDFQIIIEFRDPFQRALIAPFQHGAEQFARFARAAHDQALAILRNQAARDARRAIEIVQMPFADQAIQVLHALLALRQQDDMVGALARIGLVGGVQIAQRVDVLLLRTHIRDRAQQHQARSARIVYRAVRVRQRNAQLLAYVAQLVIFVIGKLIAHQRQRIHHRIGKFKARIAKRPTEERDIKRGVVRHQHRTLAEFPEIRHDRFQIRLIAQHGGGNARKLRHLFGNRPAGVDQLGKFRDLHAVFDAHRADFDDLIGVGVQARGFHIQHHERGGIDGDILAAVHDARGIVDQIALAARNQFDVVLLCRAKRFRKRLHHAVVGDGDRLVAPLRRLLDQIAWGRARIHRTERGMQMQLHALFFAQIAPHRLLRRFNILRHQHHFMLVIIIAIAAAHLRPRSILQRRSQRFRLRLNGFGAVLAAALAAQKQLAVDRGRAI